MHYIIVDITNEQSPNDLKQWKEILMIYCSDETKVLMAT